MRHRNQARLIGILSAAAVLSACQAPLGTPRPYSPTFRVEALGDTSAGVTTAGRVAVEAPGTTPAQAGQLVVQFGHLLKPAAQRRLLAAIADVEKITITLSGNGVNHTETILKAAIVNGATSFTFTGLPAGSLTVTIKALNAANAVIGQEVRQATVTAGQTTTVNATVVLTPAVPSPRVIVGGSGSSGSGGASGSLTTNVTLRDDVPVITPDLLGVYAPALGTSSTYHANGVVLDNQGSAWFTGDFSHETMPGRLGKVTSAGVLSYVNAPAGHGWWFLGVSPDGGRILLPDPDSDTPTFGIALDGTAAATTGSVKDAVRLAQASDGAVFVVDSGFSGISGGLADTYDVRRLAPDGTTTVVWDAGAQPTMAAAVDVVADKAGNAVAVVAIEEAANPNAGRYHVKKLQPDGTAAFSRSYAYAPNQPGVAVDGQNNVWIVDPAGKTLEKLSPTGQLLGTFATPARCNSLFIDASDRVWAYQSTKVSFDHFEILTSGEANDVISRFDADGTLRAFYHVGVDADTEQIAVSADDHLWVASKKKGLLHLELDPLP